MAQFMILGSGIRSQSCCYFLPVQGEPGALITNQQVESQITIALHELGVWGWDYQWMVSPSPRTKMEMVWDSDEVPGLAWTISWSLGSARGPVPESCVLGCPKILCTAELHAFFKGSSTWRPGIGELLPQTQGPHGQDVSSAFLLSPCQSCEARQVTWWVACSPTEPGILAIQH